MSCLFKNKYSFFPVSIVQPNSFSFIILPMHDSICLYIARSFLAKFRDSQEDYYQADVTKLASVTHKEHAEINDLMLTLRLVGFSHE